MVFQQFNLWSHRTILENLIEVPVHVLGVPKAEVVDRARRLLARAGLADKARAYGMPALMTARRVTLPPALAAAIPGLANLWLIATKDTALLAIVGFAELTLETRQAAGATRAYFTFFLAAGALYLALTLVSGWVFRRIERRARRGLPGGGDGW
jgi:polar amino acid transport system permease protein